MNNNYLLFYPNGYNDIENKRLDFFISKIPFFYIKNTIKKYKFLECKKCGYKELENKISKSKNTIFITSEPIFLNEYFWNNKKKHFNIYFKLKNDVKHINELTEKELREYNSIFRIFINDGFNIDNKGE